jgi:hypothetical protein
MENIDHLLFDIKIKILKYLNVEDILKNICVINKSWNLIHKHNHLWKYLYLLAFPKFIFNNEEIKIILINENNNIWYHLYKKMHTLLSTILTPFEIKYSRKNNEFTERAITVPYFLVKKYFDIPYFDNLNNAHILSYFRFSMSGKHIILKNVFEKLIGVNCIRISLFAKITNNVYKACDHINDDKSIYPISVENQGDDINLITISIIKKENHHNYTINYSSINDNNDHIINLLNYVRHNYKHSYDLYLVN